MAPSLLRRRLAAAAVRDRLDDALRRADDRVQAARRSSASWAPTRSLAASCELALRGARELVGTPETLGAEWMLFHALGVAAAARAQRARAAPAPPAPRCAAAAVAGPAPRPDAAWTERGERRSPRRSRRCAGPCPTTRPQRINLLIPTIDLRHFFGGYIAKFNLARRLAERGLRVRIVTVDPVGPLPPDWQRRLESYEGLEGLFDRVEVAFGRESAGLEISRDDRFIATTWWTAHIAARTATGDADRFLYLIQEYEPFTFPMGTYAALAAQSYDFPHFALFSSELLRGYFRAHGSACTRPERRGRRAPRRHSRTRSRRSGRRRPAELAAQDPRRLLFYARPEPPRGAQHVRARRAGARARAAPTALLRDGWELHGIGTVERARADLAGRRRHARAAARAPTSAPTRRCSRARRRAGADVHAAPEPRPDRDGVGGDARGHQQLREQDRRARWRRSRRT